MVEAASTTTAVAAKTGAKFKLEKQLAAVKMVFSDISELEM